MTETKHYTIASGAVPYHYTLWFEPNLKTFTFNGKAVIKIRITKATKSIKLNAKDLTIKSATVKAKGIDQGATFKLENNKEVTFDFPYPLEGDIGLEIDYEGLHNEKLYGFYRGRYVYEGETRYMLSTQFETANARAAFPCLDEPEFKATFDVSMLVDEDLEAISNMPITQTKPAGKNKKLITFDTTPKMSTYLLYLGVGKYDRVTGKVGNVKVDVLATEGKLEYEYMALDYAQKLFADLQTYFHIDYPLPKLDLLAIPDFAAGAMENWGAITFREIALLGSEKATTINGKQRIAEVVGHELAHQWFGDLVTMAWWDDMWLTESFATYMEYKSVNRVFPEWNAMLKYYLDSVGVAMVADGMKNTHPISVDVNTVGEVEELFDAIGYNKGGSVLLMLEDFVGPELFRKGLTRYLKKHSYANATKNDLWVSIEDECKAAGKDYPVLKVMDDWITREGYPVVNVREIGDGIFEIEQERFTISGNMDGVWKIPITYKSEKGEGKFLMNERKTTIKNAGSWIKLNYRQAGFYRVKYEPKNLNSLGKMIKEKKFDDLDAWGIENDLFAFVRSGGMRIIEYLEFVKGFCLDCGYPANVNVSGHLVWLNSIAYGEPFLKDAKELSLKFHGKMLDRLGWDVNPKESSVDTKMRSISISELGMEGDAQTVKKAKSLFDEFMENGREMNPNIKSAVFSTVLFNKPDQKIFDKFLSIYKGNGSPEEKIIALQNIGMFGDTGLLAKALDLSVSNEVRLQDSYIIMSGVAGSNPLGRQIYKKWAMKSWKEFMNRYDPASHMLKSCVQAFGMLADQKSLEELDAFFKEKSNLRDDIKVTVKQTLERITANIKFIERNS